MTVWRFAISLLAVLVVAPLSLAHAEDASLEVPVRAERPVLLGVSPTYPAVFGKDATVPLPAVRVGVNFLPTLAVDLTAGSLAYEGSGWWALVDFGLRWHFTEGAVSPFLMAHAGDFIDESAPNAGGRRDYPYASVGGGLEYACRCGMAIWAEAAPALVSYTDGEQRSLESGLFMSVGLGYRIRTSR